MLSEKEIRRLYENAKLTVKHAMTEVTIDAHVVEAEQQCKTFALVLGEKYESPKRKR